LKKIISWLVVLIAFFLPFEYLGSFEFRGFTIRISQILAVILIFVWLLALITKKITYKKNYITLPLVVFLAINLLSLMKSSDIKRSLTIFSFILFTAFLGWLITQVITDKKDLKKIIIAVAISSLLISLLGFWQFFGDSYNISPQWTGLRANYVQEKIGFTRIHSTAFEPLYYANYLFIPLFLFLALWIGRKSPQPTLLREKNNEISVEESNKFPLSKPVLSFVEGGGTRGLFLLIFLILSNFVLTVARGAYLAFIPSLLILIYFFHHKLSNFKKLISFILLITLTIFFSWQLIRYFDRSSSSLDQLKYEEHITNIFGGSSYKERKETINLAWRAFMENPILGIGIGSFGPYAKIHLPWWQKNDWKIVNNEYLEILAETGLAGFIAFMSLLGIIIFRTFKLIYNNKDAFLKTAGAGLFAAFIAILVQYLTFSTLYIMHIWFLIGLLAAISNIKSEIYDSNLK
jgi:O-antigen ligase